MAEVQSAVQSTTQLPSLLELLVLSYLSKDWKCEHGITENNGGDVSDIVSAVKLAKSTSTVASSFTSNARFFSGTKATETNHEFEANGKSKEEFRATHRAEQYRS